MSEGKWSRRRSLLSTSGALLAALASASWPRRGEAAPPSVQAQRLANRLELWHTYARRNQALIARYHVTRWSSLMREPLVGDGTLGAREGERLVFVDDGFSGARTDIEKGRASYAARGDEGVREFPRGRRPSLDWLADRLSRIFGDGEGEGLIAAARVEVPKGRRPQLEIRPPREHPAALDLRGLVLTLDPMGGAVVRLEITEAQGDRVRYDFSDHRQSVDARELEALFGEG